MAIEPSVQTQGISHRNLAVYILFSDAEEFQYWKKMFKTIEDKKLSGDNKNKKGGKNQRGGRKQRGGKGGRNQTRNGRPDVSHYYFCLWCLMPTQINSGKRKIGYEHLM